MHPEQSHGYTQDELDRMCLGKHRLADELTARASALRCLEHPETKTRTLYVYRCPACRGWHMTKSWQRDSAPVRLVSEPEGVAA
jgi:lipopolysaccharide biosynthesis regulator YciM